MRSRIFRSFTPLVICTLTLFFGAAFFFGGEVKAQESQLEMEIQLHPYYETAESIRLIDVISSQQGGAPALFSLLLENRDAQERRENLYFNIQILSERHGVISDEQQIEGFPFGLAPGQQLSTNYYNMKWELPELPENIYFEGGLTAAGEQMFNDLGGSSLLPPARYTIEVEVFQGANKKSGGLLVASASTALGVNLNADAHVLYLIGPGGEPGSDIQIHTRFPEFQWDGTAGSTYRLVVVKAERDESPESLIDGALSTLPLQGSSLSRSNRSNLEHEILDIRTNTPSLQFPSSGVQPLQPGERYFWQVLLESSGSRGAVSHPSEIWSFRVASTDAMLQLDGEMARLLKELLGEERYQELARAGFSLDSIELEGERQNGPAALELLRQVKEALDNGSTSSVVKQ